MHVCSDCYTGQSYLERALCSESLPGQLNSCPIFLAILHAGEAFDKIARLLGLDLRPNGGAALEAFAKEGNPHRYPFTVPLRRNEDCNFSYAGLKNSVRLAIQAEAPGEATDSNRQVPYGQHCCNLYTFWLGRSVMSSNL